MPKSIVLFAVLVFVSVSPAAFAGTLTDPAPITTSAEKVVATQGLELPVLIVGANIGAAMLILSLANAKPASGS